MVNLHGRVTLRAVPRQKRTKGSSSIPLVQQQEQERPADPQSILENQPQVFQENVHKLVDWMSHKKQILCLTGAGLSTESGIPDYRGHKGSYHNGHKPMIHDQFVSCPKQRQRYWGRALVGWRDFDTSKPNVGHHALAELEERNIIGVKFKNKVDYYDTNRSSIGRNAKNGDFRREQEQQHLSIITQNVDGLHRRAGSLRTTELHGRTDRLKCMNCGSYRSRQEFHSELEGLNHDWLQQALKENTAHNSNGSASMQRPDGDGHVISENYSDILVPSCTQCGVGFMKPDVVFFGDIVPRHRVERCRAAVQASDGLLCIGSSLAVLSAFRFVRTAVDEGIPIAILNVGETRAEVEGLNTTKIESPIGPTLSACLSHFSNKKGQMSL